MHDNEIADKIDSKKMIHFHFAGNFQYKLKRRSIFLNLPSNCNNVDKQKLNFSFSRVFWRTLKKKIKGIKLNSLLHQPKF